MRAIDYKESSTGWVLLGDDRECRIRGMDKVKIQLRNGSSFILDNVRFIPELKRNLISLGMLESNNYTVKLQDGRAKVIKGSMMVLCGTRKDNCVYALDGWAVEAEANMVIEKEDNLEQTWHKRLGHISDAGLPELERKEAFGKQRLGKLEFCEGCVLGKSTRVKFGRGQHTTDGIIDYVHTYIRGPNRVESMSEFRYFLSIVDNYSRRIWVYFLRHNNEAFERFKEWKHLVENQTGRKVKKLRTDNGLEFCNQDFLEYCKKHGTRRQKETSKGV